MYITTINQQEIHSIAGDACCSACHEPEPRMSSTVIQGIVGIGINVMTLDGLALEKYAPTSKNNGS